MILHKCFGKINEKSTKDDSLPADAVSDTDVAVDGAVAAAAAASLIL